MRWFSPPSRYSIESTSPRRSGERDRDATAWPHRAQVEVCVPWWFHDERGFRRSLSRWRDARSGCAPTAEINLHVPRLYPPTSLIIRQGLPTATRLAGMSRTTTLPAPITLLLPMVTPGQITQRPPIQTLCPIFTGFAASSPLRRIPGSRG